jgi:hypothetical protein
MVTLWGGNPMKVALIVITDGRWDYLQQTLDSAFAALNYDFSQRLIVDDSGVKSFTPEVEGFVTVKNSQRLGLAKAIQTAWDHLDPATDYVFHLEDDFIFPQPVDVEHMIALLKDTFDEDKLAQMALMRQPWSPEEHAAGSIYNMHPESYTIHDEYFSHSRLFTFNPCVYPMEVTAYGAGLESEVTERLLADGWRFAYYGHPDDPPKTLHIGVRRSQGYKL